MDTHAKLVVVDPVTSVLEGNVNSHRDQDVQRTVAALRLVAQDTDCAIVLVIHLKKGSDANAAERVTGSRAWVNSARSMLVMAKEADTEDGRSDARLLGHAKSNYGPELSNLAFELAEGSCHVPGVGELRQVHVKRWIGEVEGSADDLVGRPSEESPGVLSEAITWLRELLVKDVLAADVFRQGAEAGFSKRTLERAKIELVVKSDKLAGNGKWTWRALGSGKGPKVPANDVVSEAETTF